ncbi:hypothetical protein [Paenibacillus albidus]|uniref:hypothetical protein n=1 Tax=Paenibacillus albidus TaxID=2041023 RepID=UPI002035C933|nr:hypothetical protein [Paenibacillus albidus]
MDATTHGCADRVLISSAVFTGLQDDATPAFIAIQGEHITAVGKREEAGEWIGPQTAVHDLGNGFIMPGVHDNHVFLPAICLCTAV